MNGGWQEWCFTSPHVDILVKILAWGPLSWLALAGFAYCLPSTLGGGKSQPFHCFHSRQSWRIWKKKKCLRKVGLQHHLNMRSISKALSNVRQQSICSPTAGAGRRYANNDTSLHCALYWQPQHFSKLMRGGRDDLGHIICTRNAPQYGPFMTCGTCSEISTSLLPHCSIVFHPTANETWS